MNTGAFTPPDPTQLFSKSAEQFTKFWTDYAQNMGGMEEVETPTPDAMRKMRGAFLNQLAGAYDEYLRSPQFTEQLGQMLQQGVQYQQRIAEMLGHTRSSFQASSRQDIDSLMEVMQRLERRIGDGFARLDERVGSLESAVDGGEPEAAGSGKKATPARKAGKRTAPRAARPAAKKTAKKAVKKAVKKTVRKKTVAKKAAPKTARKAVKKKVVRAKRS